MWQSVTPLELDIQQLVDNRRGIRVPLGASDVKARVLWSEPDRGMAFKGWVPRELDTKFPRKGPEQVAGCRS